MKVRLVVRITNSRILCDIVQAHVDGDRIIVSADSNELRNYGICFGLTNYTAAYATGLLAAKRYEMLGEKRLAKKCFLDIGLSRSTKGAKVFGAMKGAVDGGLDVPHGMGKFPGYDSSQPDNFDSSMLRDRIYGKVLGDYMRELIENEPERYQRLFSRYIKANVGPDNIESIYEKAFDEIRKNPARSPSTKRDYSSYKKFKQPKLTLEQRREKIKAKLEALAG